MHPIYIDGKKTRMYRKWSSMIRRCHGKHENNRYYKDRGIAVCEQWRGRAGFDRFCEDLGQCPEGLTLERIDNFKGYQPDNCRWATWAEQACNRRPKSPAVKVIGGAEIQL